MRMMLIAGFSLVATVAVRAQEPDPYFVREGMVNQIDPPITAIWNMQVEVMDDEGNFDPALMDEAKWAALLAGARALEAGAQAMASAQYYASHDPAGSLDEAPEGTDLAAIDARLQDHAVTFRFMANFLANQTTALVSAAEARDAGEVTRLVNDIQPSCKACHDQFWYPEEYAN